MALPIRKTFLCRFMSLVVLSFLALNIQASEKTLLVFGDSLSAGYGLKDTNKGWVNLLQETMRQQKYSWRVINVSISGETTSGGLSRFERALVKHAPDLVLLELGTNDGLRGLPLTAIRNNLNTMLSKAKAHNVAAILFEMKIPPNYGPVYSRRFNDTFHSLGKEWKVPVMPFFLDGVAGHNNLNQTDGVHPNEAAQPKLLDNVWPTLKPFLK